MDSGKLAEPWSQRTRKLEQNTGKAQKGGSCLDDRGAKGPPARDAACKTGCAWMAATVQGTLGRPFSEIPAPTNHPACSLGREEAGEDGHSARDLIRLRSKTATSYYQPSS